MPVKSFTVLFLILYRCHAGNLAEYPVKIFYIVITDSFCYLIHFSISVRRGLNSNKSFHKFSEIKNNTVQSKNIYDIIRKIARAQRSDRSRGQRAVCPRHCRIWQISLDENCDCKRETGLREIPDHISCKLQECRKRYAHRSHVHRSYQRIRLREIFFTLPV